MATMTTMNTNTAMTPAAQPMDDAALLEQFVLPSMVASDFSKEELDEDSDGLPISIQRIKIPGGGNLVFELPSENPENPDYAKSLVGIILFHHAACAYWPEGQEYSNDVPPLCSSVDGKQGIGDPGGACEACALNRFGSAMDGRGKACKNMRQLYLLRSGDTMPIQLSLPPTSLTPFREFMNKAFVIRRRAAFGSLVEISLKRMNNGNDYSVATFRRIGDFSGEALAQIRAYVNSFRPQAKAFLEARAAYNMEQLSESCEVDYVAPQLVSGDEAFTAPAVLDGDRDELPA